MSASHRRPALLALALVLLGWPRAARARVDPDCFAGEDSFTCALARVDDARAADRLFTPILGRAGWAWACFSVQYVAGDAGDPATLLVVLHGARGESSRTCTVPRPDGRATAAGKARAARLAEQLRRTLHEAPPALRRQLLRDTRRLFVGDGWGGEAELSLP